MNEISIFDFEESSIRTLTLNDQPYFVGKDIAVALGYSNPLNAIKQHCRGYLKQVLIDKLGREQETTVIPEPDLYRLIFNSKNKMLTFIQSQINVFLSLKTHKTAESRPVSHCGFFYALNCREEANKPIKRQISFARSVFVFSTPDALRLKATS